MKPTYTVLVFCLIVLFVAVAPQSIAQEAVSIGTSVVQPSSGTSMVQSSSGTSQPPAAISDVFVASSPQESELAAYIGNMSNNRNLARILLVCSSPNPDVRKGYAEPMLIMSRILEKSIARETAEGAGHPAAIGSFVHALAGAERPLAIYTEDSGEMLFILNVPFPLMPRDGEQENTEESALDNAEDAIWADAKRELYGGGQAKPHRSDRDAYDAGKVARLKSTILQSLKHANNIRSLKPTDSITVIVSSAASGPMRVYGTVAAHSGVKRVEIHKDKVMRTYEALGMPNEDQALPATLAIRVKKSDVDDYGKDKIDLDEFRQRAKILLH